MPRKAAPTRQRHHEPSVVGATITGTVLMAVSLGIIFWMIIPLIGRQQAAGSVEVVQYLHGPSRQVPAYGAEAFLWSIPTFVLLVMAAIAFTAAVKTARQRAKRR